MEQAASRIDAGDGTNYTSVNAAEISTTAEQFRIIDRRGNLISPYIATPAADNQAANKKYVDEKIHVSSVYSYFENVAPVNMWGRYDFNEGSFMNIPWNDFLGATVWVLHGRGEVQSTDSNVDLKWIPVNDVEKFGGLRCYYKVTSSEATSFTIFAKITYRK